MNRRVAVMLAALALTAACARPTPGLFPPPADSPRRIVFVVEHGWHAGIVVAREDLPRDMRPPAEALPAGRYLEIGWGDHDFYQAPRISAGLALKAVLWPTDSVLHVVGFSEPVTAFFHLSGIVELEMSSAGLDAMLRHIAASFARDAGGNALPIGPGLYGNSRFYRSTESYHMFNTCNVWTARALRAAGLPLSSAGSLTVDALMDQVRVYGRVRRERRS